MEDNEKTKMSIDNDPDRIKITKIRKKVKRNPWVISTIVLGIAVIVLLVLNFGGITGNFFLVNSLSSESAGETVVDYLNSRTGGGVEYISSEDEGSLYSVLVSYQGQQIPVFVTKDGKYFVQGAVPMETTDSSDTGASTTSPEAQDIPKSDKPAVELFVMSYCPYGTQAEKGIIPVFETLGDKIDSSVKFVHYIMHGEKEDEENFRQMCIREEQSDKYLDYLKCFLEEGNYEGCLTETNINKVKLDSCVSNRAEDYYDSDSQLSEGYGVQGSPALVINGQIVSSGRDSASYLSTICSAFNEAPSECDEQLSSESPSPGFGYSTSGGSATTQAQC